jgi:hypothetical protein
MSSRARLAEIWPPAHRRDLQRRSLPRIDPAARHSPTWPLERIRRAATVGHLQRNVFIDRSALDRIPTVVARRSHTITSLPPRVSDSNGAARLRAGAFCISALVATHRSAYLSHRPT